MPSDTAKDPIHHFKKQADKNIALLMTIAEAMLGDNSFWPFFRCSLLRHVNDIKRDGLAALEALRERTSTTTPEGVAFVAQTPSRKRSPSCEKSG